LRREHHAISCNIYLLFIWDWDLSAAFLAMYGDGVFGVLTFQNETESNVSGKGGIEWNFWIACSCAGHYRRKSNYTSSDKPVSLSLPPDRELEKTDDSVGE
jgi:hypothetical protein